MADLARDGRRRPPFARREGASRGLALIREQWPQMNTDAHRSGADLGHLECEIANPIGGGVPETGVYSQSSAPVFICVHLWLPSIFGLGAGAAAGLALAVIALISPAPARAAATLQEVRSVVTGAETRVTVGLSAPARFHVRAVAGQPASGVPPRLYVDLFDTRVGAASRVPAQLPEGAVRRVRATPRDASTTRLIFDVPGLRSYLAFSLQDPFRVVIDVRGAGQPASPPAAADKRVPAHPPVAELPTPVPSERQAPAVAARAAPAPRRRLKVVLDPGHGGKDPGAFGVGGIAEKNVTLAIAKRLRSRLTAAGFEVVLTRSRDVFLPLSARTARANAEHADLFVSIHANASENPQVNGAETYYLNNTDDRATLRLAAMENGPAATGDSPGPRDVSLILSDLIQNYKIQESVALAEAVQEALVTTLHGRDTPVANLGVKRGPFYVLVGAEMPCVLVEVAFLTHQREGTLLGRGSFQEAVAEGLLHGVRRFVDKMQVAENL